MLSLNTDAPPYTHGATAPSRETYMRLNYFTHCLVLMLLGTVAVPRAQQPPIGVPVPPLGAGPFVFDTAEQHKIRVTVVTKGLSHPWAIAFLPDGGMLVTERSGRLRIVRD